MDAVGALGFLAALVYGYQNWTATRSLTQYWAVFCVASGLGAVWAAALVLEKVGVYATFIDATIGVLVGATATAFAISALLTNTDVVGPIE